MLKIFHAPRTRSHRIVWLCEEMGVPYEIAAVKFGDPSPELLDVNPLKSLPALRDGPVTMIESIAMMLYIMGRYGPTDLELMPSDPNYARYLQFLLFGEAGLAMYGNPLVATKFFAPEDKRANWTSDYLKATFAKRLGFVENHLGDARRRCEIDIDGRERVAREELQRDPFEAGDVAAAMRVIDENARLSLHRRLAPAMRPGRRWIGLKTSRRRTNAGARGDLVGSVSAPRKCICNGGHDGDRAPGIKRRLTAAMFAGSIADGSLARDR